MYRNCTGTTYCTRWSGERVIIRRLDDQKLQIVFTNITITVNDKHKNLLYSGAKFFLMDAWEKKLILGLSCEFYFTMRPFERAIQIVLNNSQRTRLSRLRKTWLLPHPPPFPVSSLSLFLSFGVSKGELRKKDNLLTGEGRGWGRSQNTRQRASLVLYNSFSTQELYLMQWI